MLLIRDSFLSINQNMSYKQDTEQFLPNFFVTYTMLVPYYYLHWYTNLFPTDFSIGYFVLSINKLLLTSHSILFVGLMLEFSFEHLKLKQKRDLNFV